MIQPGKTVGVLGGGQLGRMLAHAAERLGYRVHIYEPAAGGPAGEVSAAEFNSPYTDIEALKEFARSCDVVTYEFENIPVEPLWSIESIVPIRPHWSVLETCQNRMREKKWLRKNGIPHVPFAEVEAGEDLARAISSIGLPCVVKTADFGYDGKGQIKISDQAQIACALEAFRGQRCVVEKFIDFRCELSVIVARAIDGKCETFPVAENIHTKHILDFSIMPARVDASIADAARSLALDIAVKIDLVGLLAVELFCTDRGELLVNELAPRTHNSGHATMEACSVSQFEQQIRAVCGLPLATPELLRPSAMVNVLGDTWLNKGSYCEPAWSVLLNEPSVSLHLYGKKVAKVGRKMGHFTVSADDAEAAMAKAVLLKERLFEGL